MKIIWNSKKLGRNLVQFVFKSFFLGNAETRPGFGRYPTPTLGHLCRPTQRTFIFRQVLSWHLNLWFWAKMSSLLEPGRVRTTLHSSTRYAKKPQLEIIWAMATSENPKAKYYRFLLQIIDYILYFTFSMFIFQWICKMYFLHSNMLSPIQETQKTKQRNDNNWQKIK